MDDQQRFLSTGVPEALVVARPASHLRAPTACGTRWWRLRRSTSGGPVSAAADDGSASADDSMVFSHPNATAHAITSRRTSEGEGEARRTSEDEAMPVLRLKGTWCTNTVAHGSDLLRRWVASVEATELVVDLSDVDFCDGRTISMLLELRLIAARRGCLLRLCRPSHIVIRLFTICDLDNLLEDDFTVVPASRHIQDPERVAR